MSVHFDRIYFGDGVTFEATTIEDIHKRVYHGITTGKGHHIFAQEVTLYSSSNKKSDPRNYKNVTFQEVGHLTLPLDVLVSLDLRKNPNYVHQDFPLDNIFKPKM